MLDPDFDPEDDMRAARGLGSGFLGSLPLWAVVAVGLVFSCAAGAQNVGADSRSASDAAANAGAASRSGASIVQNYAGNPENQRVTYGGGTANRTTVDGGTNDRYRATIRNTPDAYAPNVSGGTNSCLVGASGAGSVAGFGIALGGNWSDPDCERRQLAALLHNTGQPEVSQEVICGSQEVRAARMRLGRPCLQDVQEAQAAAQRAAASGAPAPAPVVYAAPTPPAPAQRVRPDWCYTRDPQVLRRPECRA